MSASQRPTRRYPRSSLIASSCCAPARSECASTAAPDRFFVATWAEFEAAAPEMAARGRDLLYRGGEGEAMLVTVRGDSPPRIHPVNAGIVDGHLYTFVQSKSAKRADLDSDGRYALHTHYDPQAPHEFMVRGRAQPVLDDA